MKVEKDVIATKNTINLYALPHSAALTTGFPIPSNSSCLTGMEGPHISTQVIISQHEMNPAKNLLDENHLPILA